jgi:hypothetical protein
MTDQAMLTEMARLLAIIERYWATHFSTGDEIDALTIHQVRAILAFEEYASSPEGRLLIERTASDNQDPKRLRTRVVRQIQRLYREVHGRDGSLVQIEKWMRSLEGRAILDASRGRDGRIGFDSGRP